MVSSLQLSPLSSSYQSIIVTGIDDTKASDRGTDIEISNFYDVNPTTSNITKTDTTVTWSISQYRGKKVYINTIMIILT